MDHHVDTTSDKGKCLLSINLIITRTFIHSQRWRKSDVSYQDGMRWGAGDTGEGCMGHCTATMGREDRLTGDAVLRGVTPSYREATTTTVENPRYNNEWRR